MNKLLMMKYILFAALIGCQSLQEKSAKPSNVNIGNYENNSFWYKKTAIEGINKSSTNSTITQPDTTVNKKLFLENQLSSTKFYDKIDKVDLVEKIRTSPVLVFSNTRNDQYLLAYQYEGNSKNSFSSFEIGFMKNLESVDEKKKYKSSENSFETESGLKLGLSSTDIVNIKGKDFKKQKVGNETILTYRIDDYDSSAFLKRYKMPGYFIEFLLKDDKLIKIFFGFDYP